MRCHATDEWAKLYGYRPQNQYGIHGISNRQPPLQDWQSRAAPPTNSASIDVTGEYSR